MSLFSVLRESYSARGSSHVLVGALFVPLALFLALAKLFEYSILNLLTPFELEELFLTRATLPLLMGVLAGVLVGACSRLLPRSSLLRFALGLALFVAMAAGVTALFPPKIAAFPDPSLFRYDFTEWLSTQALAYIRWDVLVLLCTAALFTGLLEYTNRRFRPFLLVALHLTTFFLALVAFLNFGYFLTTGAPGDWHLLLFTFANLPALLPVMQSEMDLFRVALLCLPLVIAAWPALTLVYKRPTERTPVAPMPLKPQPLVAGVSALLILLLAAPSAQPLSHYGSSTYLNFLSPATPSIDWTSDEVQRIRSEMPLFDATSLRLVPDPKGSAVVQHPLNVVVILLESTRWDATTPYVDTLATTPFLDSLTENGLLIERMFTNLTHTNKVMAPIFGGIYPYPSGDLYESAPGAIPAQGLAALLAPHGYRSAFFTPASLEFERKDIILQNLGFDEVYGHGSFPTDGFHPKRSFGYEDRIVLEPTLQWVDQAMRSDSPFVLGLLTLTTHHAYSTPPTFAEHDFSANRNYNQYLNAVRYQDDFLRDLFAGFEARGLLESTLFVLVGDHGQAFREHGQIGHNSVIYDETLRVPALLYNPILFPEGRTIEGVWQHVDFLPTIAELMGYAIADGELPGRSLLRPYDPGRSTYHTTWNAHWASSLQRDSLKYVYHFGRRPMEVFNTFDDPFETRDLASQLPQEELARAESELMVWRQEVLHRYHKVAGRIDVDYPEFDRASHLHDATSP